MSNIVPFRPQIRPVSSAPTMSSREIAQLVEKRHDNVKRTVETLVQRGTIACPQIEDVQEIGGNSRTYTTQEYLLDKRSSLIVVAQLSPEFTARIVDRWQRLEEEKQSGLLALPDFTNPAEAARAWAEQVEAVQLLEREQKESRLLIAAQAPAVEAQKVLAATPGSYGLKEAAKLLSVPPMEFIAALKRSKWIYRSAGRGRRWMPYASKIAAGMMEDTAVSVGSVGSTFATGQARITAKGLAWLAERTAKGRKDAA